MATPEEMEASMIANFAAKTGKVLEDWLAIVKKSGLAKHGEIVKLLKTDHGMGHGFANLVAHRHLQAAAGGPVAEEDLVAQQYAGAKSSLKPIYDALVAAVSKFGKDVEVSPKKTYVSLRRKKQFALFQPSTATRLDVGLNLKGVPTTERLEASGSFNSMCTHRVRLTDAAGIDKELTGWLKAAYDAAG